MRRIIRIGSFTLAIGSIVLGIILLSSNLTGKDITINFSLVWPILLVLLGVEYIAVTAHYGTKGSICKVDLPSIILVLLILYVTSRAGISIINIKTFNEQVSLNFNTEHQYKFKLSDKFTYEDMDLGISKLLLDNKQGDILVMGKDGNEIRVEAKITIHTNDKDIIESYLKNPVYVSKGEQLIVRPNQYNYGEEIASKPNINYVIHIPRHMAVEINGGHGSIGLSDLSSSVFIKKNNGNIKINSITGNIEVINDYGRVEIMDVKGNVIVQNQHGKIQGYNIDGNGSFKTTFKNIEVEKLTGKAIVDTTNATVYLKEIGNGAEVATTFGRAELEDVKGDVVVKNNNGDVFVTRIEGKVDINTSFGMVRISDTYDHVKAITSHGDIVVNLSDSLRNNLVLETSYSDVYFSSPRVDDGIFTLFTMGSGMVDGDYDFEITTRGNEIMGTYKIGEGRNKVGIKTSYGSIMILIK